MIFTIHCPEEAVTKMSQTSSLVTGLLASAAGGSWSILGSKCSHLMMPQPLADCNTQNDRASVKLPSLNPGGKDSRVIINPLNNKKTQDPL